MIKESRGSFFVRIFMKNAESYGCLLFCYIMKLGHGILQGSVKATLHKIPMGDIKVFSYLQCCKDRE